MDTYRGKKMNPLPPNNSITNNPIPTIILPPIPDWSDWDWNESNEDDEINENGE